MYNDPKSATFNGHWNGPDGKDLTKENHPEIYELMLNIVNNLILGGITRFIIPAGAGFMFMAFEAVLEAKKDNEKIDVVLIRPYPSYGADWLLEHRDALWKMVRKADRVIDVGQNPHAGWKIKRMYYQAVEMCGWYVTGWNGEKECPAMYQLLHALKKRRRIVQLDVEDKKIHWHNY